MFDSLRKNSRIIVYIVVAAFVVTGAMMGFGSYMGGSSSSGGGSSYNYIAVINGTGITPQQYMEALRNQAPQSNLSQFQVIPFRFNVLNTMIERQLIMEQSEKMGIEHDITDKDVDETINNILEQEEMTKEELVTLLNERNSSLEQFRKDIQESLQVSSRLQQTIDQSYAQIQVTEDEIKEAYEASNQESEYAEVKEQLEKDLLSEKQNRAFQNWLENIKAEAEISINDSELNAYYHLQKKNYDQAIELFNNLLESNPSPVIYHYLALAYAGNENQEKVVSTYQDALEEYPDNWELNYNFASYYHGLDEKENALHEYDNAAEKAGEDLMAHYRLYMAYMDLGAEEKAEAEMNKLSEIQEKSIKQQEEMQQLEENQLPETDQNADESVNNDVKQDDKGDINGN